MKRTSFSVLLLAVLAGCEPDTPEPADQPGVEEWESRLAEVEEELPTAPPGHTLTSTYRKLCAEHLQQDRAIAYLGKLVAAHPEDSRLRIEYANAFIDKIPTCTGVAAFLSRGDLARKALDQLDAVLQPHPDLWAARYCRGMNHLHWPKILGHSDDAIADFRRCLELQNQDGSGNERSYYLRTHVALGDAYTKAERYDAARETWRKALELFPDAAELRARLAFRDDGRLLDFVLSQRSLDQPVDTDLSFVDYSP